jgi:hypothetical protein
MEEDDEAVELLTAKEKKRNKAIHSARARVETVINSIKRKWKILNKPWSGPLNQLNYLMLIAAAVHNRSPH